MHVATTIEIEGAPLQYDVRQVRWAQAFYGYDRFSISVADPDLVGGSGKVADIAKDLASKLGKTLVVHLEAQGNSYRNHLLGIITQIRGRYVRRGSEVVIEGIGAVGGLDEVVHTRFFQDKTWDQIVKEVIAPISGKLSTSKVSLGAWANVKVPFCCQYQETDFAFLRRLCAAWGWILCAPGNDLVVVAADKFTGIPGYTEETVLIPGANCVSLEAFVRAVAGDFDVSGYQYYGERGLKSGYGDDQTKTWASTVKASAQGLAGSGVSVGHDLYNVPGSIHEGGVHWGQKEADDQAKRWAYHSSGKAAGFGGRTVSPTLRIGRKATVDPETDLSVDWIDAESILVVSVDHSIDAADYSNRFVGTSFQSPLLLDPSGFPSRDRLVTVPGTVVKSDDPSRIHRIQVRPSVLSPKWLSDTIHVRVAARAAGKDHGELLLPEVGDEVLLAFHPDAFEEPMVTAVLYNGTNKTLPDKLPAHANLQQSQIDKNDLKWTLTKGGNALVFDDTSGSERLLAITKTGSLELSEVSGGPHMALTVRDGQDPKCVLTFDKKGQVTLQATNVLFDIMELIVFKAGKDFTLEAQGKIQMKAGADLTAEATGKIGQKAGTDFKAESGTAMSLKGGTDVKVEAGMNASVKGSMQLKLEGGMQSELKGGAMVTIQGGIVKIN